MDMMKAMLEQSDIIRDQINEYGFLIFPQVDRKPDGTVGSTYPCWYHKNQLENDQEDLKDQERQLDTGAVPSNRIMQFRQSIAQQRERLNTIIEAIPRPEGPALDKIRALNKAMEEKIKPSLFSEDDMKWGDADAHDENRIATTPSIPVTNDILRWLLACGVNPQAIGPDKTVSRNQLIKGWKISSRILEINSNTRSLYKRGSGKKRVAR